MVLSEQALKWDRVRLFCKVKSNLKYSIGCFLSHIHLEIDGGGISLGSLSKYQVFHLTWFKQMILEILPAYSAWRCLQNMTEILNGNIIIYIGDNGSSLFKIHFCRFWKFDQKHCRLDKNVLLLSWEETITITGVVLLTALAPIWWLWSNKIRLGLVVQQLRLFSNENEYPTARRQS